MKPILEIDAISKRYLIQKSGQQPYLSLRDSLAGFFKRSEQQEFWALKDVSFQVQPGESIGIIGKNGAGKSTLLKILSQITPPTSGKITARGRIASLLEVGTGFHAELTGRENIFMNGSILGMKKAEILSNFDAIVDFSGVEQFLDTPLKHYSSGMQLRLAFAVAAFLENEILIIDEVLAVGDAEFQNKCMGKMNEVAQSGRTILFVSHNMGSVAQLCSRIIMMQQGQVALDTNDKALAFETYYKNPGKKENTFEGNDFIRDFSMSLGSRNNQNQQLFTNEDEIRLTFNIHASDTLPAKATILLSIHDEMGQAIFSDETVVKSSLAYSIPANFLVQGKYTGKIRIHSVPTTEFLVLEDAFDFEIQDISSDFIIYNNYNYNYGKVFSKGQWLD